MIFFHSFRIYEQAILFFIANFFSVSKFQPLILIPQFNVNLSSLREAAATTQPAIFLSRNLSLPI